MMKKTLLVVAITSSQFVFAQDYNLASIYEEITALDGSYQKSLTRHDVGLHMATKDKAEKLVERMEKITDGSLIHPASQCRAAAIYLQTARNLQWITANSKYATATDKRIDQANIQDSKEKLRLCNDSVHAKTTK